MFAWKVKDESKLVPIFRRVYFLQLVAAIVLVVGLCLAWWHSDESLNAFNLLDKGTSRLLERDVSGAINPLLVLWLLWPLLLISGLRGLIGLMVPPVSFGWLALVAWVGALLALAHFYFSFGGDLPDPSPLDAGSIETGYWLALIAVVSLGMLLIVETRIRAPEAPWAAQGIVRGGPVDDAKRLWEGEYQTCPHCGMLNEPGARTCYNCQNLLFSFDQKT